VGSTEKRKYRCTSTNFRLCNGAIIILKITVLNSVSVCVAAPGQLAVTK